MDDYLDYLVYDAREVATGRDLFWSATCMGLPGWSRDCAYYDSTAVVWC